MLEIVGSLKTLFSHRKKEETCPPSTRNKSSEYWLEKLLQDGIRSQVFLAKNSKGERCVLKKIDESAVDVKQIRGEITAMKKLCHPGVVKLLDHFREGGFTYLIIEYVDGLDLFQVMESRDFEPLPEDQAKEVFRKLVHIVEYCHENNVLHRDIKPENVMVALEADCMGDKKTNANFRDANVKLIDFGLCSHSPCNKCLFNFVGSPEYVCPEIIQRQKGFQGCKSEVWSLGGVLYTMLFGQFPFSADDRENEYRHNPKLMFPTSSTPEVVKDLLQRMLSVSADERFTIAEVMQHSWLQIDAGL